MTVIVVIALVLALAAFAFAGLVGAPYVPIHRRNQIALLDLIDLKPGQTIVDLGSGDGQLLRAAAKRGLSAIGYEINPVMVAVSWLVCWPYRKRVSIHRANLWHTIVPPADAIYVFLMPRFMARLDAKLANEIKRPTTVISYVFPIPGRTPVKKGAGSLIYRYPPTPSTKLETEGQLS